MTLNLATILREGAARFPDKVAVVLDDATLTYRELDESARRLAAALAGLGVRRGQHVALMMPNVPQFTVAYFAAHYLGAPVVPLNVQLTPHEIAYHLAESDAVALVAWEGIIERVSGFSRVERCKRLIVAKASDGDRTVPDGMASLAALVGGHEPVAEVADTMPDDTAAVLFTSGTTGRPKAAELTHFNLFFNADCCASHLLRLTPQTVGLAALPLFHSFGQTLLQNSVLRAGGTLVMMQRFDPAETFALMHKHRVSLFAGTPRMFFALLHHPKSDRYDLSLLEHCVSGGAALPGNVMRDFDRKYGANILEGYGLSETSPVASFNVLDRQKKAGSIGIPIHGVEFMLADEEGIAIADPMVPGEICIKGHNVMKGYYKRPEATAEAIRAGWLSTGDVAYRDAEGYYFIVDRKKALVIRGGYDVYPREIGDLLYAHPVREAAVTGLDRERRGEDLEAVLL